MFSLRLVCLAIFAACILAMSPCELPESFQTELSQVNLNGTCATQYSMGQLYFDYAHQLLRIDIAGTDLSSTSFTASIFQDYNSMTQYVFDREHDVCVSNSLNGSMDKPVIPSSANLQATVTVGSETLHAWSWTQDGETVVLSVTSQCSLGSVYVFDSSSEQPSTVQHFWNFLPSVPPYIFDIPSECQSSRAVRDVDAVSVSQPFRLTGLVA